MKKHNFLYKNLLIPLLWLAISSCAPIANNEAISSTAQNYLQKASASQDLDRQRYQLLALNQLIDDNNINDAEQLLANINNSRLNQPYFSQKIILNARLQLKKNNPRLAIRKLKQVNNLFKLPQEIKETYYLTSIESHLRNNNLAYSTLARISLTTITNDQETIRQNYDIIWHDLQTLPIDELNTLLKRSKAPILRGWIDLAIIAKKSANIPQQLVIAIQNWTKKYPDHPAIIILPDNEALLVASQTQTPSQIALLLPLNGQYAQMGQAVRDGFMTAFYANSKKLSQIPRIKIYDTSQDDNIISIYNLAIQEGAKFIIGPLTKTNVYEVAKRTNITVPTLALNYLPDNISTSQQFIQFGLSPEKSAEQIADLARQHNVTRILTITPQDEWGNKIKLAFTTKWQQLNGQFAGSIELSTNSDIASEITSVLNIDKSKQRIEDIQQLLGTKLKTTEQRRQDIDGIFLIATPTQARQIRPLINYYYAGDLPIFSIYSIYNGFHDPHKDHDLNDIYFNEMPWLVAKNKNKLQSQIKSLWPTNYRLNSRLYGIGVDSYTLSMLSNRLTSIPNLAINGVTGQLYLDSSNRIYQQLQNTQFKQGVPIRIEN